MRGAARRASAPAPRPARDPFLHLETLARTKSRAALLVGREITRREHGAAFVRVNESRFSPLV